MGSESDDITLKLYQKQYYQGISTEKVDTIDVYIYIYIYIYTDKIIYKLTINENNHIHTSYAKEVNEEMKCKNKIRYIIINKIYLRF